MQKSNNYWVSIKIQQFQGRDLWTWCLNHSMTEEPILYSKAYSVESEAIRLAEKFSEETGIRFAKPVKEIRKFSLIQGGLNDRDVPKP